MILLFITIGVLLIGIGLIIWAVAQEGSWWFECTVSGPFGLIFGIVGIIALIVELIIISCAHIEPNATFEYEKVVAEREVLVYRLEQEDGVLNGNNELYEDIIDFNNYVREHKTYSDNPWIGWFYNQKIQDIDYIELDRGE